MVTRSNQSRFRTENQSLKQNNARFVKPHTNTCITTTAKHVLNCAAKSVRQLLVSTTVIKERLKPNIIVRIARARCSAGNPVSTSLCTNAAMIIARTVLTRSNNSALKNTSSGDQKLHNSNSATFTANTCTKPKNSLLPRHLNQPSTSERSTTLPTSSD